MKPDELPDNAILVVTEEPGTAYAILCQPWARDHNPVRWGIVLADVCRHLGRMYREAIPGGDWTEEDCAQQIAEATMMEMAKQTAPIVGTSKRDCLQ